jgi:hypothetical protein
LSSISDYIMKNKCAGYVMVNTIVPDMLNSISSSCCDMPVIVFIFLS